MKKLSKLKLCEISEASLNEKEMVEILGGAGCCQCSCAYANSGGSSTSANKSANDAGDKTSDGSHPCCDTYKPEPYKPEPYTMPSDNTRVVKPYCAGGSSY